MPYKIFLENDEHCVYKHDDDGNKVGKSLGCHPTKDEASDQMAALYARENKGTVRKAIDAVKAFLAIVDDDDRSPEYSEPDSPPPSPIPVLTKERPLAFWKGKGDQWMWLARYSDSFRDNDWPVKEIVSSESHKHSIDMIDKGVYPMPELWLWHEPSWKWGQATVVAYDEVSPGVVFAMAGGTVDKGKEWIAEAINKSNNVLVSHGMPRQYVQRDADDPSIISKHMTYEVSPLPSARAAINRTGFVVFQKGVSDMAVTQEKRAEMADALGVTPEALAALEGSNKEAAKSAVEAGTQNKEKSEPAAEQDGGKGEGGGGVEKDKAEQPVYATAADVQLMSADIVKGLGDVLGPLVKQVGELTSKMAAMEMKQAEQDRVDQLERKETTPAASMYHQILAVVTKAATPPDDEDEEEKKKPKGPIETKETPQTNGSISSPFLNNLIRESQSKRVGFFNMARGGNDG